MAKAATNKQLKMAFEEHLKETKNQIKRLQDVASEVGVELKDKECKAMKGLIKEGEDMIKEKAEQAFHDAGLIASAQRVEHYEIAGYGTVINYLQMLKFPKAADLLIKTLEEEKEADKRLSGIAEKINSKAMA
jgi:ferritin-like metal-binding protein YciE